MSEPTNRTRNQLIATILEMTGGALLIASVWLPFARISGAGLEVTHNGFANPGFLGWPILVTGGLALIAGTAALLSTRHFIPVPLLGFGALLLVGLALLAVLPDKHAAGLLLVSNDALWHQVRSSHALTMATGFGIKIAAAGCLILLAASYPDVARLTHRSLQQAS